MSTLALNKHTPVDATAGSVAMTLPTGAAPGSQISVAKADASSNTVTVTGSVRGATATLTLAYQHESLEFIADPAGSWWPVANHLPKAVVDAKIAAQAAVDSTTYAPLLAVLSTSSTAVVPTVGSVQPYTAASGQLTPVLPALSSLTAGSTYLAVQKAAADTSSNTVVVTAAGSDTFDSGATTLTLKGTGEIRTLQVVSIGGTKYWKVVGGNTPLSYFDTVFTSQGEVTIDSARYGHDLAACLAALPSTGGTILLTKATYNLATGLVNTKPNVTFQGGRKGRTTLNLTATNTVLFQNGSDSGNAYDSNEYNGPQGITFRDLTLQYGGSTTTALTNGAGTYGAGTYGIRDWRGGDIRLERVRISGFEYGFWGIQSDVNNWDEVDVRYCKTGIYAGPRSDQFSMFRIYTALCDRALDLDSVLGFWARDCKFVGDGATGSNPIRIMGNYSRSAQGILFDSCWFEHLQGVNSIEAFIELGVASPNVVTDIVFRDPMVFTNAQGTAQYAQYLVKMDAADHVFIQARVRSQAMGSLAALIRSVHTANRNMTIEGDVNMASIGWSNGGSSILSPMFLGLNGGTSDGLILRRNAAQSAFRFRRTTDSQERWRATVDGQMFWGGGALANTDDVSLIRSTAGTLAVQSASNGAGFLQASPILVDVNTATYTTSSAIDAQVFPSGVTAVNGVAITDQTNHLVLTRQFGKWYKTAAMSQIA